MPCLARGRGVGCLLVRTDPRTVTEPRDPPLNVVYFIGAGDPVVLVKIGTTTNITRRLAQIRRGWSVPVHVLETVEGGYEREAEFHERFRSARVAGEWFHAQPVLAFWADVKRCTRRIVADLI